MTIPLPLQGGEKMGGVSQGAALGYFPRPRWGGNTNYARPWRPPVWEAPLLPELFTIIRFTAKEHRERERKIRPRIFFCDLSRSIVVNMH